jgi:hypothetical protein
MNKQNLVDVFTPSMPARVTYVDRDKVNNRIVRALKIPGMQIVVYGHTGSGKTTLLENILCRVYEKHIKTNCMKDMTFEQIILDAFDQLAPFYLSEKAEKDKSKTDLSFSAAFSEIKGQIGFSSEHESSATNKRLLPPQLTTQNLARFIGGAGYCWVLEDFHKIKEPEKVKLAQMMKLFADLSDSFPLLKIIAIGAVNTAREVVKYDNEMNHRVSEIHVDLMSEKEMLQIIDKGCVALNINLEQKLKADIVHYSNGLAAICHKLCFILCEQENINETLNNQHTFTAENLKDAIAEYIEDTSDSIKSSLDKALKLNDSHFILKELAKNEISGLSLECIKKVVEEQNEKLNESKIQQILDQLQTEIYGENIIYDADSAKYSFTDPFVATFARALFNEIDERPINKKTMTPAELTALFNKVMRAVIQESKIHQGSFFDVSDFSSDPGVIKDSR